MGLYEVQTDVCVCARVCVQKLDSHPYLHLSCDDVCDMRFFECYFLCHFISLLSYMLLLCVTSQGTCTERLCVKRIIYFLSIK